MGRHASISMAAPFGIQNQKVGSKGPPVMNQKWTSGICDCCDPGCCTCCFAFYCTSCLVGNVTERLQRDDFCCAGGYAGACFGHFLLGQFLHAGFCVTCPLRGAIRFKYGIEGSPLEDCFCTLCCEPCSVEQMNKEVARRKVMGAAGPGHAQ